MRPICLTLCRLLSIFLGFGVSEELSLVPEKRGVLLTSSQESVLAEVGRLTCV